MNMSKYPIEDTCTKLHQKLSDASTQAYNEGSKQSKEEICGADKELRVLRDEQGVLDIGVSYD